LLPLALPVQPRVVCHGDVNLNVLAYGTVALLLIALTHARLGATQAAPLSADPQ
jgi:hypothetical protein